MSLLVLAHGNELRLVEQNVRRHQDRIAEKAVCGQVLVGEIFLHLLVAGHALEPAERRNHAEIQWQFEMLLHLALHKDRRSLQDRARRQESRALTSSVLGSDARRVRVVSRQRVQVGDEEVALVLAAVLQLHPVGERAHVVAQVELAGGAHAAQNARTRGCIQRFRHSVFYSGVRPGLVSPLVLIRKVNLRLAPL